MSPNAYWSASAGLFRPSRPDFIETPVDEVGCLVGCGLFRPSRPDFIETPRWSTCTQGGPNCSGPLGRTSLRLFGRHRPPFDSVYCSGPLGRTSLRQAPLFTNVHSRKALFRPSRPDFIETDFPQPVRQSVATDCSGLLGRTSLRQGFRSTQHSKFRIVPAF